MLSTDTEAAFLDLHLSVNNDLQFLQKIYDKRDDFDFDIVNSPMVMSLCVHYSYISQLALPEHL